MKKISLYSFILALFIVACGNEKPLNVDHTDLDAILASGNLDSIVAKKEQLYAQQKTLSEQIKQLNDKIEFIQRDYTCHNCNWIFLSYV